MLSHYAFIAHISLRWLLLMWNSFKFTLKRKGEQNKPRMDKAREPHSFCFLSIVLPASVLGHGCIKLVGKVQAGGRDPAFSRSEDTRGKCLVPFNKTGTRSFYYWVITKLSLTAPASKVVSHGQFCFKLVSKLCYYKGDKFNENRINLARYTRATILPLIWCLFCLCWCFLQRISCSVA